MNKGSKSISRGEKIVQGKIVAYHRLDSHLFPVSLSPISKPMGKKCEAQIYSFAIYSSRPQNRKSLSLLTPSNRYGSMGTACFYTTPPIISILGNEPRCSKGCFVVVFTKNPIFASSGLPWAILLTRPQSSGLKFIPLLRTTQRTYDFSFFFLPNTFCKIPKCRSWETHRVASHHVP